MKERVTNQNRELTPHKIVFKKEVVEDDLVNYHFIDEDEFIELTQHEGYAIEYNRSTMFENGSKHVTLIAVMI